MSKLEKIASMYNLSHNIEDYRDDSFIAPELFADNINKKYPMHTKNACELSMAEYMYDNGNEMDKSSYAFKRLDKAASNYGIAWPVCEAPLMCKVSAAEDDGEILEVNFPNTAEGATRAMAAVLEFRKTAHYTPCRELARGVVKIAFEHDCDIPDDIMKLAGYAAGSKEAALEAIAKRANRVGGSAVDSRMNELMDSVLGTPGDIIPPDDLTKIAEVLDAFDGLREDRGYTTYNTPPEQELFNKSAFDLVSRLEDEVLIPSVNTVVSKNDLTKNASIIMPILSDMGIKCDESKVVETVAGLNERQANYLFGELND